MSTGAQKPIRAESEVSSEVQPAWVIRLAGVRKSFRKKTSRGDYTTIKSSLVERLFGRRSRLPSVLHVLDGVDLDVAPGTTLGIIGRNGSGKSTFLKLIAGIIQPDSGQIEVRGKISPLIELGAGFHPEFSGRENVLLNGLVLGLTRSEIESRFDSIVAFAELAEFIDDPVRTYSSGMYMRLAFSVAVHADPDVLLIDEILTVGDEGFVSKCRDRLAAFQAAGKTIVIVSHDLDAIERWCHEAIWLERGAIAARGFPAAVVRRYHAAVEHDKATAQPESVSTVLDSRFPGRLLAEIRTVESLERLPEAWHVMYRILLEIENRGDTVWRSLAPTRRGMVMVGGRLGREGRYLGELERALIPRDVYPGERVVVELKFRLPGPGRFDIELDLVDEEICWFAENGSHPLRLAIEA